MGVSIPEAYTIRRRYHIFMWRLAGSIILLSSTFALLRAEVRKLTLKQTVGIAMKQNPDIVSARLDEQQAEQAVRIAKDPFIPKVFVGSGAAYSYGYPMSIEGSAPSVFQARAVASIFNRPLSYQVAQAKEDARGRALDAASRSEEIALRTASLFLDAERAARAADIAWRQVESARKVAEETAVRVREGRELAVEARRAELNVAVARQHAQELEGQQEYAQRSLSVVLGFDPQDQIEPAKDERALPELPASEESAAKIALENSREVKRLESSLLAKGYEVRANKAAWLPTVDLVAQYGLFSKFNNYEDFFRKFQRHNGQIGVSFQVPIYAGAASAARTAQAELEVSRIRVEVNRTRSRVALEARQSYQQLENAKTAAEVARLDLEVAREQLSILLARMQEGRVSMRDVENARYTENEKWIAFLNAQYAVERAAYELAWRTGSLMGLLL